MIRFEYKIISFLIGLGVIFNMATWYHPQYVLPVIVVSLGLLPVFLILGLKRPVCLLWFILMVFLTQDSFPNNVLYETYYGYEAATVYFHNFLGPLSVFDVLLFGSIYWLVIKQVLEKKIHNLFATRIEYYLIGIVVVIALVVGLARQNLIKTIFSEFQLWFYGFSLYLLILLTVKSVQDIFDTSVFIVILLSITIPMEFYHYITVNYHSLLAVVGRIRKPLLNGTDDTYMVLPVFILLGWIMEKRKSPEPFLQGLQILGVLAGLGVIYLNIGRTLALVTFGLLAVFFIIQRFQLKMYLVFGFIGISFAVLALVLQPEHIKKLGESFTTAFSATQDLHKDMSAGDRIIEFENVHETLKHEDTMAFGLGWGGLWDEYYYQPGRGSLASYADKTQTRHVQTHIIFSNLMVKCGYLGMLIICLSFFSLGWHFIRVYKYGNIPVELKSIMQGLLFTYPVFFYFGMAFQIGIFFAIVIALLRKIELLSYPLLGGESS